MTDEQIAIFRHSEIETLLRERRHIEESRQGGGSEPAKDFQYTGLFDDSVLDTTTAPPLKNSKKQGSEKKKVKKARQSNRFCKQTTKPDLRKRTWDNVDSGLPSLIYDDDDGGTTQSLAKASKRKRVSYNDE